MWLLFVAGALVGLVLVAVDNRMWDEGGPGIIEFEIAGTEENAREILDEWGDEGRDAARLSLWLDFLYLALYGAFWALAIRAVRDMAARRGWERFARAGGRLWAVPIAAAGFDALEDVALLIVLGRSGGDAAPLLAAVFAGLKFLLLAVTLGYVALALLRRFPRTAAALAVAGAIALAVNTVLVERATERASEGVLVMRLAGHDIHVAQSGTPTGPPLVLVHGFGCSMRWWEPVLPALRRFNVVRLDLLGHGDSEKPRDGYSMENQADIVAGVIRALHLRRPAVVGHSMGGIVGTALVERHPELVGRLMMIGTAPDDEDENLPPTAYLPFVPVAGHAVDTLIPDRIVRWAVEGGFAPKFDPPKGLERDFFDRTTYSSLNGSSDAVEEFWNDRPLNERLAAARVPVTAIMGEEEDHTKRSTRLYNEAGLRTVVMEGLNHTPQVESPPRTAALIAAFAAGR
jgi:pimeloyl-ACP methyl ester carboxylesterase